MNEDYSSAVKILISFGLDEKQATEAVDKIKDLGKETKKGGEMAEHANVHHREMRELFTHMNKLVPGLGEAMHAAFAGPIGPLILLGIAIGGVQEVFKKYNEELDKVSADQIKEHTAEIGRVKSAWDGAQQAIGKYYAALATAGEEKDPIEKALANIKAVESAQIESSKKIIEALGKQEVAFLRAQGASPDQIAAAEQRNAERTEREDARKEYGEGVGGLQAEQAARQAADARLKAEAEAAS